MITQVIAPTTTNSLFAILEYPELRFLISDKIKKSMSSDGYSVIGIGFYETLMDSVSMSYMWGRIGLNSQDILMCIQSIQSIGGAVTTSKVLDQIQAIKKAVIPLNIFLGVLDLLLNANTESFCNIELVVNQKLQTDFDNFNNYCMSNRVVAKRMGMQLIEGVNTPMLKNGVNIIDDAFCADLGGYLLREENHAVWIQLLSRFVGALEYSSLQCINVREFSKLVFDGNKSAIGVMVKFYLAANGFATIYRNEVPKQ